MKTINNNEIVEQLCIYSSQRSGELLIDYSNQYVAQDNNPFNIIKKF